MKKYITSKPYQAKLQLRPANKEALKFIENTLKKDGAEITEIFERKEGLDILVTSSRAAFRLAKKFKDRFKGETKVTRSLVGEDKHAGKLLYRLTVLLRLPKE